MERDEINVLYTRDPDEQLHKAICLKTNCEQRNFKSTSDHLEHEEFEIAPRIIIYVGTFGAVTNHRLAEPVMS